MKRDPRITRQPVTPDHLDLKGLRAAVVGGTGGLGRAITRLLTSRGAQVIVVGQTFRDRGVSGIEHLAADLSSMREAERIGKALPAASLDLLVLTTGIFAAPERQVTAEGIERDMAVSYLSRLVLLREVVPRLGKERTGPRAAIRPRVFVMGYPGDGQAGVTGDLNAEKSYRAFAVHMNTVAGNEMLVLDWAERAPDTSFFGLNPGLIKTSIRDNFLGQGSLRSRFVESLIGLFMPSPERYAERMVPLLVAPELEGHSGTMFDQKGGAVLASAALSDRAHVRRFLDESSALVDRALGR